MRTTLIPSSSVKYSVSQLSPSALSHAPGKRTHCFLFTQEKLVKVKNMIVFFFLGAVCKYLKPTVTLGCPCGIFAKNKRVPNWRIKQLTTTYRSHFRYIHNRIANYINMRLCISTCSLVSYTKYANFIKVLLCCSKRIGRLLKQSCRW